MNRICALVCVALCGAFTLGENPAIVSWTGGTEYESYWGLGTDVVGWDFRPTENISVTSLGYWLDTNHSGLEAEHQVGIWVTSTQQLLVSATLDRNDPITNLFHWQAVTPVALQAGVTYTIGGGDASGDNDWYLSGASTLNMDPKITWLASRYPSTGGLGFVFPTQTTSSFGRFGANFAFVPEPASVVLCVLALVALRRR